MSENPLVSGPVGESSTFKGTFLIEDGEALCSGIRQGDWVEGGMAAFSLVLDTAAGVADPIGTLFAMGFGWIMEHVQPLKGWMNDLTGDASAVGGFAATWTNIEAQLTQAAHDLRTMVYRDLDDMAGLTITAYRDHAEQTARHIESAGSWAGAMALGLETAATLVQIVHDIVRDAIAQIAGALCSYAIEAACTLGLATPLIITQATTRTAALAKTIGTKLTKLTTSLNKLDQLLTSLKTLYNNFTQAATRAVTGPTPAIAGIPGTALTVPGPTPRPRPTGTPKPPTPTPGNASTTPTPPAKPQGWDDWDNYETQKPDTKPIEPGGDASDTAFISEGAISDSFEDFGSSSGYFPQTRTARDVSSLSQGQTTRDPSSQWYMEELSNEELIYQINHPPPGEEIIISLEGSIYNGHHRLEELARRVSDGRISLDTPIQINRYG